MALMPEHGGAAHAPSWYAASAGPLPAFPRLEGETRADVVVVGAGYTGLATALRLAERGYDVAVVEANKVGWGASGRNGGQIHPGQRRDPDWMAARLGEPAARRLVAFAEEARQHQLGLIARHGIDCDFRPGLIEAVHRARDVDGAKAHAERLSGVWGLGPYRILDRAEAAAALGTDAYHGAAIDPTGGHLHPLKFLLGLARAATAAGARIFEDSRALQVEHGGKVTLTTAAGRVVADTLVLAGNGYLAGLDADTEARILPLNNFILTTEPLESEGDAILPGDEAAADSRFVVYYWRKTPDGRLLFGGGETFGSTYPGDVAGFVRRHMTKIYPRLKDVRISHAWGGTLGITVNRLPYVRRPKPNVWVAAGYSGQGVMMAPYAGHILAEAIAGVSERFDAFAALPCPPFPGGRWLRLPTQIAAMSWFALLDRL
ncbi:NAD(P)/FAD-dependent oxidoreductase [Methylobrevis pamukkalensis]|uniref:Gamma-glutamylputrescine oxidoreductase n=1 Tax=Methylobrevis pamukkalensis TaxID=1439726 RepID=A0A1E3GZZ0_9HYPH|nr:FAD-binding oxidoreductase [Methylobrevis pamukkalensis]ODN69610.1 Gamma-glutamylputrescine oxidoreductase [Methylobrevis pamukkalensis]